MTEAVKARREEGLRISKRKHLLALGILVGIILHSANDHECSLVKLPSAFNREESPEERTDAWGAEFVAVGGMFHIRSAHIDRALWRG